jgi:hypothetical protein
VTNDGWMVVNKNERAKQTGSDRNKKDLFLERKEKCGEAGRDTK